PALEQPSTSDLEISDPENGPPTPADQDSAGTEWVEAPSSFQSDPMADLSPQELALFQVTPQNFEDSRPSPADLETQGTPAELDCEQQEAVLEMDIADANAQPSGEVVEIPLTAEQRADTPTFADYLDPAIEEYLDSSTVLRQHLEASTGPSDPKLAPQQPKTQARIAILTLGLVSLGVVGVIFLYRARFWKRPQPVPVEQTSPAVPSASGPASLSPTAKESPLSSPATGNNPAAPLTPGSTSTAPLSPSGQVPVQTAENSESRLFYVVLPYTTPEALSAIQATIPLAFVTDSVEGKQIQVGALETLSEAQILAAELRKQGLSATIVSPN
ncbi:MAG: hypothetical protein HC934_11555, partial [Acaryochloridaceae cyanobacterium SU_2_1]|nr:hypothetical protein [Acaryochloridaceae cyanobacterium SU_2_1]